MRKKKTELDSNNPGKAPLTNNFENAKPEIKAAILPNQNAPEKIITKAVPSVVKGVLPGSISIKQEVKTEVAEEKEPEIEVFDPDSDEFLNTKSLVTDDIEDAWKEYAEKLAQGHPNLYSTLLAQKPTIGAGFEIKFEVKNTIQEKEINAIKSEMATFLRERLNNRFIRIKIEVNTETSSLRPYRPEEIFKHFAEKNPAIIKLRQRFGLEPDY